MVEFITDNQRSFAHQGGDVTSVCGESHSKHHSSRFPDKPRNQGFEFLVDRKSACCKRMLKERKKLLVRRTVRNTFMFAG